MQWICLAGVFCGAAIMLAAILKYYRALANLRAQSVSQRLFSRWTYGLCMGLMCFFLCGYIALGIVYIGRSSLSNTDLLISMVFFFGAIFVYVVITVQQQMSGAIADQADEVIRTMVNTMEAKDRYTRGHSVHVANIVALFYQHLPEHTRRTVNYEQLTDAAVLHDIGKIGISDNILNKPGKLTEEEFAVMRTHPRMGKEILSHTSFAGLGDIILAHHERMDQQGYYRMPPEDIPVESRIIAIADTFSALYSDRVYRPAAATRKPWPK